MKKLMILILSMAVAVTIVGCRSGTEPAPPAEEIPKAVEYPYDEIEVENMLALEIFNKGEKTPMMEESSLIQEVVTLIQKAELIGEVNEDEEIEIDNSMGIQFYLQDEVMESRQGIIRYSGKNNRLYIGPEGIEFVIESEGLVRFIQEYSNGELLIVEERVIPTEAREWLSQFQQEKGAYIYQHPDATYIMITSEERPTGGYQILLRGFDETTYPKEITIEVIEPDPDAMVTQAITFPTIYLKVISEEATQYSIMTVDGETYDVEEILIFSKLEIPEENETITNPVRVKGKIIAFEGSFVVRILDEENNLIHEEFLQADAGGPAWGNFDEEISYPEVTANEGSIELGEYSAKDGSYILREKVGVKFN